MVRVPISCFIVCTFFLASTATSAGASAQYVQKTQDVCDRVSEIVSKESGVPFVLLKAIALVETGRTSRGRFSSWPWTANIEGKGFWFDSELEAKNFINTQIQNGVASIDIGCFQINLKWHGHSFRSPSQMLEPITNARYAAQFLKDLHSENGDWISAAGKYHSRTLEHSTRYVSRLTKTIAELNSGASRSGSEQVERVQRNTYPLLQNSLAAKTPGSLFSSTDKSRPSLFSRQKDDG